MKLLFYVLSILLLQFSCVPRKFDAPNIILIMADDLGYGDLGCYGNTNIKTPNLDKMASEGLRFMDYHSNGAVCSPTRAALLTGRYQQRSGIEGVVYAKGETRQTGLDIKEVTFADFMKSAGYATGIVGKWHLGYNVDFNPIYQGFDFFRGYVSGNIDYHSHLDGVGIPDWWHDLEKTEEEGYVTDLITKYAISFIEENKSKPFCLYVSHESPHYPFQGRNDEPERLLNGEFKPTGTAEQKKIAYKEMIEVMDEGVGDIFTTLKKLGLKENTFVFFCSDNGGIREIGSNGNLRGNKGKLWEGGHRVPAIAWWPRYIEPGKTTDAQVMSMDVFPTFINLSKVVPKYDFQLDGMDFTRLLIENKPSEKRSLFWKYRNQKVVRNGKWKLLVDKNDTYLYNLEEDISEQNDLSSTENTITNQLKSELENWEQDVSLGVKLRTK